MNGTMPQQRLTPDQADQLLAEIGLPRYGAAVFVGVDAPGGPEVIFVYVPHQGPVRPVETFAGLPVIVKTGVGPFHALAA